MMPVVYRDHVNFFSNTLQEFKFHYFAYGKFPKFIVLEISQW